MAAWGLVAAHRLSPVAEGRDFSLVVVSGLLVAVRGLLIAVASRVAHRRSCPTACRIFLD